MRSRKLFGQRTGEALDRLRALPPPGVSAPVNSTPARGKRPVTRCPCARYEDLQHRGDRGTRAPPGLAERRGGDFVAIMGASGSGKSTMMNINRMP